MSENPYNAPAPSTMSPGLGSYPIADQKKKMPGGLMAVCIICLILGSGGALGSCFGTLGLAVQAAVFQNMPTPAGNSPQAQVNQNMMDLQRDQMIPNAIILGLNFFVAPILIAGSIGMLSRKKWGRKFLKLGLFLAIGFVLIKACITFYLQMTMMKTTVATMQPGGGAPAELESVMGIFLWVMIAFSGIMFLVMIGFYIFSILHLGSKKVNEFCSTFE